MDFSKTILELLQDTPGVDDGRVATDAQQYCHLLAALVRTFQPWHVLELGTGCGRSAAFMMTALPNHSRLTTINWPNPPSPDPVGVELTPWQYDERLLKVFGDTRSCRAYVDDREIDFLFIDSGDRDHNFSLISEEWRLYESALTDTAVVCCDDIHFPGSDMERFWEPLPYEKVDTGKLLHDSGFGVFRYVRQK